MIDFRPFEIADLDTLEIQPQHVELRELIDTVPRDLLARVMEGPYSWTAWTPYGIPVAACGILRSGEAWAILCADLSRSMVPVTRKVREVLRQYAKEVGPATASIEKSHPEAVRWARVLGFQRVGSDQYPLGVFGPCCELWRYRDD
jgi:hypothetical protein